MSSLDAYFIVAVAITALMFKQHNNGFIVISETVISSQMQPLNIEPYLTNTITILIYSLCVIFIKNSFIKSGHLVMVIYLTGEFCFNSAYEYFNTWSMYYAVTEYKEHILNFWWISVVFIMLGMIGIGNSGTGRRNNGLHSRNNHAVLYNECESYHPAIVQKYNRMG